MELPRFYGDEMIEWKLNAHLNCDEIRVLCAVLSMSNSFLYPRCMCRGCNLSRNSIHCCSDCPLVVHSSSVILDNIWTPKSVDITVVKRLVQQYRCYNRVRLRDMSTTRYCVVRYDGVYFSGRILGFGRDTRIMRIFLYEDSTVLHINYEQYIKTGRLFVS